tara:strand:- start:46 stop:2643 length:2598 start_codon:yes stop_codon:yes gene_type:complete
MSQPKTQYLKDYQKPAYLIETVHLIVELGEDVTRIKSQMQIRANGHDGCEQPLVLNGDEVKLIAIAMNGTALTEQQYQLTGNDLVIPAPGSECELDIEVEIKPQENTKLMGLYQSSGNFCTQCEPQGFRGITYYIDRPDNLAVFTTTIIGDKAKYPTMLSNGNKVDEGETEDGRHWVKWHDPHKKSPHLFALVAGTFDVLDDEFITMSGRKVALRLFVEPGNLDKCAHAMHSLKLSMKWDEEVYGREYDLDIFMTVAVGDFNMGAMENKGLNIFNTKYILASPETATDTDFENVLRVVGHEYFHNWSGNRVGCRDWFQLSLKEGLTVFRDQSFTTDMTSPVKRVSDVNVLRTAQFKEDAGPMSHPIRPASYIEINNFYTLTVYEKGAEVIRMMHTLLGPKKFRQATDLYFSRFDEQSVTTDDFVDCMQEASGVNLSQFRLWYSQAGTPELTVSDSYDADKKTYTLHVKQHTPATAGQADKQALHIPLRVGLLDAKGDEMLTQLVDVKLAEQDIVFDNITTHPVPSLLRGFSAPVKLHYDYSNEQLQLLLAHDTDVFARWEAGQLLALRELQRIIAEAQADKPLTIVQAFIDVFATVLADNDIDPSFKAHLLVLPSEAYLADQMDKIDMAAIHKAREFLSEAIAHGLQEQWLAVYHANYITGEYVQSQAANGKRMLANTALAYLMKLHDSTMWDVCATHYHDANNMTDQSSALACFASTDCPQREKALAHFYEQFKDDALVLDKWFTIQSSSKLPGALAQTKALMQHEAFSIKNPNKVRSLIGGFCMGNAPQFHDASGEGYVFLADIVKQLDKLNPQVASRMVGPLTHWKRYVEPNASLMKAQLDDIVKQVDLSKDTFEIVSKALK